MKKSFLTSKKMYIISLGAILLISVYPLIMGIQILFTYVRDGYINAVDYPKYVIPYTPISFALIISAALMPAAFKFCKRFALLSVSSLGAGLFLLSEILFERITVFDSKIITNVESWQLALCFVTPEVMRTIEYRTTIGKELALRYSPAFKVHFYLIALLIVLAVIGVIYGFSKMVRDKNYDKLKALIVQAISVSAFIGLCIFACFTAFYRTGELKISAISSWLMSIFFILFGVTAGAYAGGLLYAKRPVISRLVPAVIAAATIFAMYLGELILMGGVLFKFGDGFIFNPVGVCPLAPIDFIVIAASGLITYFIHQKISSPVS